jgi:hypothetical protein
MEISIRKGRTYLTLYSSGGLEGAARGYEVIWSPRDTVQPFILSRPDGSSWHWSRKYGRWTQKGEDILDGWQRGTAPKRASA